MAVSTPVTKMAATNCRLDATLLLQMALDRKKAGQQLAALREAKRKTQDNVKNESGLSLRTVQRYELGEVTPRFGNLDALARSLGDEVYRIFAEQPAASQTAPDVMGSMNGDKSKLEERVAAIEKDVAEMLKLLRRLAAADRRTPRPPGTPPTPQRKRKGS